MQGVGWVREKQPGVTENTAANGYESLSHPKNLKQDVHFTLALGSHWTSLIFLCFFIYKYKHKHQSSSDLS